jgi:membrane-bound serine protease (ClpP class)
MKLILFLYLVGLVLICFEVFVPGGILGAIGFFLIVGSIWIAFVQLGSVGGSYFLAGGLVLAMVSVYLVMRFGTKTGLSRKLFLQSTEKGFRSTSKNLENLKGKTGISLTTLRPSGKALIDGGKVNVVSEGVFLSKGCKIKVVMVEGNRVVVRKIDEEKVV